MGPAAQGRLAPQQPRFGRVAPSSVAAPEALARKLPRLGPCLDICFPAMTSSSVALDPPRAASASGSVLTGHPTRSRRALDISAAAWLGIALIGQLLFAFYLLRAYAAPTLRGDLQSWNIKLPHGYSPGDHWGNALVGLHLLFALLILVGGALQLLPPLRRAVPAFHRWVGRSYLMAAAVLGLGGLMLVWTRPAIGGFGQHLGISLNALLMLGFAAVAWRAARARRIQEHRAWALRLFLVVSGVWFFRLGLPLWLMAWRAPVGFDPQTFSGPFLTALSFAQTLLPLAVFELLRWAQRQPRRGPHRAMAATMALLCVITVAGIAAAFLMLWRPHL